MTHDVLPLTCREEEEIKHFLLVYERGLVPPHIMELADRIKETPEGIRIHQLQARAVCRMRQTHS